KAPIAEERPVAAHVFHQLAIALHDQNLFLVVARLLQDLAERVADERAAPELDPVTDDPLVPDAVDRAHVGAVGDGVPAHARLPRRVLPLAELDLLARVPADGGGAEDHLRALQRRQPARCGLPRRPADEGPYVRC